MSMPAGSAVLDETMKISGVRFWGSGPSPTACLTDGCRREHHGPSQPPSELRATGKEGAVITARATETRGSHFAQKDCSGAWPRARRDSRVWDDATPQRHHTQWLKARVPHQTAWLLISIHPCCPRTS